MTFISDDHTNGQNDPQKFSLDTLPPGLRAELSKVRTRKKGVFVPAWLVHALDGDTGLAMFVSQSIYWSTRSPKGAGGSFFFSKSRAYEQIGIGRKGYDRACKRLKQRNICTYVENKLHDRTFSLNWRTIAELYEKGTAAKPYTGKSVGSLGSQRCVSPREPTPLVPKGTELEIPGSDLLEILSLTAEKIETKRERDETTQNRQESGQDRNELLVPADSEVLDRDKEVAEIKLAASFHPSRQRQTDRQGKVVKEKTSTESIPSSSSEAEVLADRFVKLSRQSLTVCRMQMERLLDSHSAADVYSALAQMEAGGRDSRGKLLDERGQVVKNAVNYLNWVLTHTSPQPGHQSPQVSCPQLATGQAKDWRKWGADEARQAFDSICSYEVYTNKARYAEEREKFVRRVSREFAVWYQKQVTSGATPQDRNWYDSVLSYARHEQELTAA